MNEFFTPSVKAPLTCLEIDAAATAISDLLAQSSHTKSIPAEQIAAELKDDKGIAAFNSFGALAGYVALRPFGLLTGSTLAVADAESPTEALAVHFGLGSLVVHPNARGRGLGTVLLDKALTVASHQLHTTWETANVAVVSAVAAPTSQKLFADSGFRQTSDPAIAFAHGYDLLNPLPATKQVTYKVLTNNI